MLSTLLLLLWLHFLGEVTPPSGDDPTKWIKDLLSKLTEATQANTQAISELRSTNVSSTQSPAESGAGEAEANPADGKPEPEPERKPRGRGNWLERLFLGD